MKKIIMTGLILGLGVFAAASSVEAAHSRSHRGIFQETAGAQTSLRTACGYNLGVLAKQNGKLSEFQAQVLENKQAQAAEAVAEGSWTQEEADQWIQQTIQNQANCDGSGLYQGTGANNGWNQGTAGNADSGAGTVETPAADNGVQGNQDAGQGSDASGQGMAAGNGMGMHNGSGVHNNNGHNSSGGRHHNGGYN